MLRRFALLVALFYCYTMLLAAGGLFAATSFTGPGSRLQFYAYDVDPVGVDDFSAASNLCLRNLMHMASSEAGTHPVGMAPCGTADTDTNGSWRYAYDFPAGMEVTVTYLTCGIIGSSLTNGQTATVQVRWRDRSSPHNTVTNNGSTLAVTVSNSANHSGFKFNSAAVNAICPYATNGCLLSIEGTADTTTTGTFAIECTAFTTF